MVSLMAFFTGRKPSLSDSEYSIDPTMQQLYWIAKCVVEDYIDEDTLGTCLNSCDKVRKHLRNGLAATQSLIPSETKDHIERCIVNSLSVVEAFYAKYASHDDSSSPSPTAPTSEVAAGSSSYPPANQWEFVHSHVQKQERGLLIAFLSNPFEHLIIGGKLYKINDFIFAAA